MEWLGAATQQAERIFRAARTVAPDDDAAWDCVQEAFATALERAPAPDDPVAWLCGTARNHARHATRARSRWTAALDRLAQRRPRRVPEPSLDLHDALRRLPLRLRDAVTLRYLAGMSHAEVAQAQHVSETAAKARVRRGLAELRRLLGATTLTALLAREAAASRGKAALLRNVALLAPAGGVVMKKWVAALVLLLCAIGTIVVWRATREPAAGRDVEARGTRSEAEPAAVGADAAEAEEDGAGAPAGSAAPPVRYPADRPVVPLRGRVVDPQRSPVEGATVRIATDRGGIVPELAIADDRTMEPRTVATGADGRFALDLPAGPYRVTADANGLRAEDDIAAGTARGPVLLVLAEPPPLLEIVVRDDAKRPVAGARLEIVAGVPGDGVRTFFGVTDAEGRYRLDGVRATTALVEATTDDGRRGQQTRWNPLPGNAPATVVVTVADAGGLAGRLTGVEAARVEGARVTAWTLSNAPSPYNSSFGVAREAVVAAGRYRFDALPAGRVCLTLDAPGVRLVTGPYRWGGTPLDNSAAPVVAEVRGGERSALDLAVTAAGILEGVVTTGDGTPVAGALVRVTFAPRNGNFPDGYVQHGVNVWRLDADLETFRDHPSAHWHARTDADGRYRLASLPPGLHRVEVFAAGLSFDRREEVVVEEAEPTRLEHRLAPAGVLQVCAEGIGRFGLVPAGSDRPLVLAITSGREAVTIPGLPAGRYHAGGFHGDPAKGMIVDLGEIEITAGRTTWWDLRGTGRYVVRGHVTDPAGPVSGLRVRSYGTNVPETDAQGAFELRSLTRYGDRINVEIDEGAVRRRFTVETGNEMESTVEIALSGHALVIHTRDAADAPIAAELLVRETGEAPELVPAQLASEDTIRIPHLRPARYALHAQFAGGGIATAEVDVPATRETVLRAPPTGRIELEVSGAPENANVIATAWRPGVPRGDESYLGYSSARVGAGRVTLPAVPAGSVEIRVQPAGWGRALPFRVESGPPSESFVVDLDAGTTVELQLAVD